MSFKWSLVPLIEFEKANPRIVLIIWYPHFITWRSLNKTVLFHSPKVLDLGDCTLKRYIRV